MGKNKLVPPRKSRREEEGGRRSDINKGIERFKMLIPYLRNASSIPGQKPEDTRNDTLRLTATFLKVVSCKLFSVLNFEVLKL